jgi:hypothetical protein
MLCEYFSIKISDNCVCALPQLIPTLLPDISQLPKFLLRLSTQVRMKENREKRREEKEKRKKKKNYIFSH